MISLSTEQRMVLETVKDLAENEFADRACQWEGQKPIENLKLLAEQGFLGMTVPEKYGGAGMTPLDAILVRETIGRICPDTAYAIPDTTMGTLAMFGSESVKETYLAGMTAGESIVSIGMSEPQAGSDIGAMNTTVEEDGDELVLNGEKIWVSGVQDADASVIWAKFPEGIGSVIMDFDADGVKIGEHYTNMFGHTQSQFYMEDVVIPEEHVLVRGEESFKRQLRALNWERLGTAALSNAIAMCAFDQAVEYAGDREQFGQPIGDFQGIEWKISDMTKMIQTSRTMVYQAAMTAHEQGGAPTRLDASVAALHSAEILETVTSESLQIFGSNGFQQGHPLEYLYRLGRSRRIAAGTDEIQKNTIAKYIKKHGLPGIVE